tara:strand:- start:1443 stop:2762 length:1320 start_codon:yes stop_codon:yes gene_type:complete
VATIDCTSCLPEGETEESFSRNALNSMSQGLGGSQILKIAGEIKALQAQGTEVCNLTVGDFSPTQFRIPDSMTDGIGQALAAGQTNYPPAVGLPETRKAVRDLYERDLGLRYKTDSVIMGSGARPPIFATVALVVEPGDKMLFGIPSWNNPYYVHLSGAQAIALATDAASNFLLTADQIAPQLEGVTLLCLNSPLNPCGTAYSAQQLGEICDLILTENRRRAAAGKRPVMVMYDQVYWMLCFGETQHHSPVSVRPEMAPYTIFVDAISKSFAATGLRVGWAVVPPALTPRFKALIGHMGAWAPRPAQLATAALLQDPSAIRRYHASMKTAVEARLNALHQGFSAMAEEGLPVRSMAPQGAIYLSVKFDMLGRNLGNQRINSDEDIRAFLLNEAGLGVVPFQAFGLEQDSGWMRFSVGAVSVEEISAGLDRVRTALRKLN